MCAMYRCFGQIHFLLLLLAACGSVTEPAPDIRLELSNGMYRIIEDTPEGMTCRIQFDYQVQGCACKVGGYGIYWDEDQRGQVDWYAAQTLIPDRTYSLSDTFSLSPGGISDPEVSMQGCLMHASEPDPRLTDRCTLENVDSENPSSGRHPHPCF